MTSGHEHNRRAWDRRARHGERFATPAADASFADPLGAIDVSGWLGDLRGRRVLCLAAGGGNHAPLFAAAGAITTVVDISREQLALDRQVAAERGLDLQVVETSMDDLSMLPAGGFDVVNQPVSTCYVPDVTQVYRQVARVLRPGGLYVSQHKQPVSLQADERPTTRGYELVEPYYTTGPLRPIDRPGRLHREHGTLEFLHRLEDLLGGLCRAGFVIEDVREPAHGDPHADRDSFAYRSYWVAPYLRIKARRRGETTPESVASRPRLWTPE